MIKKIFHQIKIATSLLLLITLITGFIYPLLITGIANIFFPWQATGSLISKNGELIGSKLIGQTFTDPKYFMGRPSATKNFSYNSLDSSGSNLSPTSPIFLELVKERIAEIHLKYKSNAPIPLDLVTASASGLDPEISPAAAYYQAQRIANQRNIPVNVLNTLIKRSIEPRTLGILGEPRVNVFELNLALDQEIKNQSKL